MTDRDRKILEFAGLHRNEPTGGFWWDKEGNEVFDFHKPGEKIALTFIAEYVFPKLIDQDMSITIQMFKTDEPVNMISIVDKKGHTCGWGRDTILLEACLQAVEQAIK